MQIPKVSSPEWSAVVEGRMTAPLQFLATRILVSRHVQRYKQDPTPETRTRCIHELVEFFERNIHIPAAQRDLNSIFGGKLS